MTYSSWPLGMVPKEMQRPELDILKDFGVKFDDPREVVTLFEQTIAEFAGSNYAVAVDCCTNALFLCLKLAGVMEVVKIPYRTYCSVPMSIIHAGCVVEFEDRDWSGLYQLGYSYFSGSSKHARPIYDGAARFRKGMYISTSFHCLSFQLKKRLPIGRGGMILTDDKEAADWLRCASFSGRHFDKPYQDDQFGMIGWNMYMTPEDAARGLLLFNKVKDGDLSDMWDHNHYPDLREQGIFK